MQTLNQRDGYVSCVSCGNAINESLDGPNDNRVACPNCGSTSRAFEDEIVERAYVADEVSKLEHFRKNYVSKSVKSPSKNKRKPIYSQSNQPSLTRDTGQINMRWSVKDRENDW